MAKDVIERCGRTVRDLARSANGPDVQVPEIRVEGHLEATFPYILSHLEYIVGELLRNSVQAVIDHHYRYHPHQGPRQHARDASCPPPPPPSSSSTSSSSSSSSPPSPSPHPSSPPPPPPPIEVTVCEAQRHVIIRISDRGGGIPRDVLPHLWSFAKEGPVFQGVQRTQRLENLVCVPMMAATLQELRVGPGDGGGSLFPLTTTTTTATTTNTPDTSGGIASTGTGGGGGGGGGSGGGGDSSLSPLSSRPPNLRLGMGLPLSRVYAEYWAGSLELHSLEGYGVDAFLQISKLGNKNERLATRAAMDAV